MSCVFIEVQRLRISHFKAFDMTNLQQDIRICKKIYNRVTMIKIVYNEISDSSIYKKLLKCDVFKKILAPFLNTVRFYLCNILGSWHISWANPCQPYFLFCNLSPNWLGNPILSWPQGFIDIGPTYLFRLALNLTLFWFCLHFRFLAHQLGKPVSAVLSLLQSESKLTGQSNSPLTTRFHGPPMTKIKYIPPTKEYENEK